jgi:hypothetical protein
VLKSNTYRVTTFDYSMTKIAHNMIQPLPWFFFRNGVSPASASVDAHILLFKKVNI